MGVAPDGDNATWGISDVRGCALKTARERNQSSSHNLGGCGIKQLLKIKELLIKYIFKNNGDVVREKLYIPCAKERAVRKREQVALIAVTQPHWSGETATLTESRVTSGRRKPRQLTEPPGNAAPN